MPEETWKTDLFDLLVEGYGQAFADRVMQHVEWVLKYPGYGAPGHMDYILIQTLINYIKQDEDISLFNPAENDE